MAAQEQALRTNLIHHSIDKTSLGSLYRLHGGGFKKLAKREHRKRHDK